MVVVAACGWPLLEAAGVYMREAMTHTHNDHTLQPSTTIP